MKAPGRFTIHRCRTPSQRLSGSRIRQAGCPSAGTYVLSNVGVGQALEKLRSTALGDAGSPIDNEVLSQPLWTCPPSLDRKGDAWIALQVPYLLPRSKMAGDYFVVFEANPYHSYVRAAVGVQRDQVGQMRSFENLADSGGNRCHGSVLS